MPQMIQDERAIKLYGDKPVIISKDEYRAIIDYYSRSYTKSEDWFRRDYEDDFIRYRANYLSIPGDVVKPWADGNEYFMPSTNITVENYVARQMETVRGARDFLTVFPRGRDDAVKAKSAELYLNYTFENPMKGYQKLVDVFRCKDIYGTTIATMPWAYEVHKNRVQGTYIWDRTFQDWIREAQEEGNAPDDNGLLPPKDFSGLILGPILESDENLVVRDLFSEATIKDHPDLDVQDLFNVKVDPAGGNDIQNHAFTIVESIETEDEIRRKVAQNIYDKEQANLLFEFLQTQKNEVRERRRSDFNPSISDRNAIEGQTDDYGVEKGVRIWICYGKHEFDYEGFEEEAITIIAENKFLLRHRQTHFQTSGRPYRPILVDRFISLPNRFYGIGIGQILEDLNYLLNHQVNQVLNHGDLYNSPPLIYPAEGQWDPEFNIFGPGQSWASDNTDGFKILETPDIKASQVAMIQFVEGFIAKSLGVNDFTLDNASDASRTAHGLANVIREANRRIDFYAQNTHEGFVRDMYEMMLWQAQQFMDETEIRKITDKIEENGEPFTFTNVKNEDIQGLFDFKIFADSITSSREFEQVQWQNNLQIFSQLVDPRSQAPLYDIKKLGDRALQSQGEPFPENYHAAPPQQGPPGQLGVLPGGEGTAPEQPPENPQTPDQLAQESPRECCYRRFSRGSD